MSACVTLSSGRRLEVRALRDDERRRLSALGDIGWTAILGAMLWTPCHALPPQDVNLLIETVSALTWGQPRAEAGSDGRPRGFLRHADHGRA